MKTMVFLCCILVLAAVQLSWGRDKEFIETQIRRWNEEIRKNPKDFETMAAIGSAYGKLSQHQKAIEYFQKAIDINPSYADAYLGMAAAYGFLGRLDDKIAACRKAISLKPDSAEAYANLGSALGKAGKYKESIQALREAIRLKPDFADAHFALGLAYLASGDPSLALKQSKRLEQIAPGLGKQLRDIIDNVNKGTIR
jgi:tetratricopeptide (TPR) repeat protein